MIHWLRLDVIGNKHVFFHGNDSGGLFACAKFQLTAKH